MTYHLRKGGWEQIIFLIPLIATVSLAVISDFRNWRIPNNLIAFGLIQGFTMSALMRGIPQGLVCSVKGCVLPVAILYVLFLIKALGAGDIKLLAVAGSFVGPDISRVISYSFLAGGVISIIYLLKEFILSITNRKKISNEIVGRSKATKRCVHFSAAIFGGIMYYAVTLPG